MSETMELAVVPAAMLRQRTEIAEAALRRIAGGFINSSFVMRDPPDWHSAFAQLQVIAQDAIEQMERAA